jgi:hypothetical protein
MYSYEAKNIENSNNFFKIAASNASYLCFEKKKLSQKIHIEVLIEQYYNRHN